MLGVVDDISPTSHKVCSVSSAQHAQRLGGSFIQLGAKTLDPEVTSHVGKALPQSVSTAIEEQRAQYTCSTSRYQSLPGPHARGKSMLRIACKDLVATISTQNHGHQ